MISVGGEIGLEKTKKLSIFVLTCILMLVAISTVASSQDYDFNTPDDAGWALFGLGFVACILPIIWLVVAILIAIWVYRDAEKRGSSGALWLIIVIITGIIGLIIWLVVRPPIGGKKGKAGGTSDRNCPNCGRSIPLDAQVCPYCGKDFKK